MLNLAGVRDAAGWWMGELWYSVSRGEALEGVSQGSLVEGLRECGPQPRLLGSLPWHCNFSVDKEDLFPFS
jgi:hypothetical protein